MQTEVANSASVQRYGGGRSWLASQILQCRIACSRGVLAARELHAPWPVSMPPPCFDHGEQGGEEGWSKFGLAGELEGGQFLAGQLCAGGLVGSWLFAVPWEGAMQLARFVCMSLLSNSRAFRKCG